MIDLRTNRWQLPDGVNELLPDDAWRVEFLRRQVMDNAYRWGYELVMPPMIEYLESLLTGTGEKLDLQTFKLIDQHNGRSLGIRADMTPQVARMDAHALQSDQPNRLFYTGSVLRARTDSAGSSRTPLQFGAELFGHPGPESDAEIIRLMLDNVSLSGITSECLLLDVGHVGVYRALISEAGIDIEFEKKLFAALVRGSRPEVQALLLEAQGSLVPVSGLRLSDSISALMLLSGESEAVLAKARSVLAGAGQAVTSALDNLQTVLKKVTLSHPDVQLHVDLSELRGFAYHTGILFTLYDQTGLELSRGGRYDAIGEAFGRARPATGFSGDLISLALARQPSHSLAAESASAIWVSSEIAEQALEFIGELRSKGERVIVALPGSTATPESNSCKRELLQRNGSYIVESCG